MKITKHIADIRQQRSAEAHLSWGLVPTMGYLHEGHLSLIQRAKQENERVGVSIFVNPTQFNDANDLSSYPQDLERDLALLKATRADLVWIPDANSVYPKNFQTYVTVENITSALEGAARSGHFRGVATIVAKLFNVFQPQRAYFGQKDAQQVAVIRQMVRDLNFNLNVVVCPTIREADGLAMSSRNAKLSPAARKDAICLYEALNAAKTAIHSGERSGPRLRERMQSVIQPVEAAKIDYVSAANPQTLEEWEKIEGDVLLSLAVFVGGIRLIDNMLIELN